MHDHFLKQIYNTLNPHRNRIVFLDRDGTIISETRLGLVSSTRQIKIFNNAIKAIKILNSLSLPIVIVTNQPIVARGIISIDELAKINDELFAMLKKQGAFINAIYSCPHHPDATLLRYRMRCECRKPNKLLLEQAAIDFNVAKLTNCFMVGDQSIDIETGEKAGLITMLVKTGWGGKDKKYNVNADFFVKDLYQAAVTINKQSI